MCRSGGKIPSTQSSMEAQNIPEPALPPASPPELLSLDTMHIWSQIILCRGDCPVGCLAASPTSPLSKPVASPQLWKLQIPLEIAKWPQGERPKSPQVENKWSKPWQMQSSLCLPWKKDKRDFEGVCVCVCVWIIHFGLVFEREIHSVLNHSLGVVRGHDFMDVSGPRGEEKDLGGVIKCMSVKIKCQCLSDQKASSRFSWPAPLRTASTGKSMRRTHPRSLLSFWSNNNKESRGLETLQSSISIRGANRKEAGRKWLLWLFWITWSIAALPITAAVDALSFGDASSFWIVNFNSPVVVQMTGSTMSRSSWRIVTN